MRKIILALTALAGLLTPVALAAAPANADFGSPGCVTRAEWRLVHTGQSRWTVARIVGTDGRVLHNYGYGVQNRTYRTCAGGGLTFAGITYVNQRVNYKATA